MDSRGKNQLLCTFAKQKYVEKTIFDIKNHYIVLNNKIYIFYNQKNPDEYYLTYNVLRQDYKEILRNTISVHRKNKTNTIYTINALNRLIIDENNGILDKNFKVDWELYQDTLILTTENFIKLIGLKFEAVLEI